MRVEKTGNWRKADRTVRALQHEMRHAQTVALKRWGLFAERTAVGHIARQDLRWRALKPATVAGKVRQGYSENILVRSSTYFQSITSYVIKDVAYAGVRKMVNYSNGAEVANIAAVHEFGTKNGNIPARPLWQPTYKETVVQIIENPMMNPVAIFMANMQAKV